MSSNMQWKRIKFIRNLRTIAFVAVPLLLLCFVCTVLYLNATGMPLAWRQALEKELAKQGIEITIARLRYVPLRGIEATEVEVFSDPTRTRRLAHLERIVFDLDKTKALRGDIRLTHIDLQNAELQLPVDPDQPDGDTLNISQLSGKVLLTKSRKFEIKNGRGVIDGVHLSIDAVILGFRPIPDYKEDENEQGLHRRLMREFVQEIQHWNLDPQHPPELALNIEADATKWSSLKCQFTFSCKAANRDEILLEDLRVKGNIVNALVSINELSAHDKRGRIDLAMDYDLNTRIGNFDGVSTLDVPHWSYQLTGRRMLNDFSLAESPRVQGRGQFRLPADARMSISMQGRVDSRNVMFRGSPFSSLSCEYSLRDEDFFLRNIQLKHADGEMSGHVLQKHHQMKIQLSGDIPLSVARPFYRDLPIAKALEDFEAKGTMKLRADIDASLRKNDGYTLDTLHAGNIHLQHPTGTLKGNMQSVGNLIHYEIDTNFTPEIGKPFFLNQPLEYILGDFKTTSQSKVDVKLTGAIDRIDHTQWNVQGVCDLKSFSYRGVPIHSCRTTLDLNRDFLLFNQIAVDFDYTDYELQRAYQGGTHGPVQANAVRFDRETGLVQIDKLSGNLHPVPLLRMFAKSLADSLTDYRFHAPPKLTADGSIDIRDQGRTNLQINLLEAKAMTWEFLGKPTVFSDISSLIQIDAQQTSLTRLSAHVFGGTCNGIVKVLTKGDSRFSTEMRWNSLSMEKIAENYEFKEKGYGTLTGRIFLTGLTSKTNTLEGEGLCSLEKGELFAVPIFGPLSHLIAGILGDKRAGFDRAKDAFCNFTIDKGVLSTNDFVTNTMNLKFTGNGKVDINKKTIDFTMRMNARGLLGIFVLPLQPIIKGLFQFQGTGPMDKPEWEHVMFTSPPEEEKDALLRSTPQRAIALPQN
jgi:uncharacterized protein involved in outer membrane biogenesis